MKLFEIGGTPISVATILTVLAILSLTLVASRVLQPATIRAFRFKDDKFRVRVPVGVTDSSDMASVKACLHEVAAELTQKWRLRMTSLWW